MSARRFSEMAADVAEVARKASRPAAKPADDDQPSVPWGRCTAFGCPLSGALSESTLGTGPWFCRHHFGQGASSWSEITRRIRQCNAAGIPIDEARPSPTVEAMRMDMRSAPDVRSREPGEDDE